MPKTVFNEQMLQTIWMASRHRRRPWALVVDKGKVFMLQADQPHEGDILGIYDKPTILQLRDDLMAPSVLA